MKLPSKGRVAPLAAKIIEFSLLRSHQGNEKGKIFRECEYTYQSFNKGQNRHYKSLRLPKQKKKDDGKKPKKSELGQPHLRGRHEEKQS